MLARFVTDRMGESARCCDAVQSLPHASTHLDGMGTSRIHLRVGMLETGKPSVASCSTWIDQSRLARAVKSDNTNSASGARSKP